ncbi:MAG: hypothetical protein PHP42_10515 [Bacteroidota bacterium]|nr:hypothetical protein [Bacteroidota bacterium]
MFVLFRSFENYAAVNQQQSDFNISIKNSLKIAMAGFHSQWEFIEYSIDAGIPFNTVSYPLQLQFGIMVSPWKKLLQAELAWKRMPFDYSTSIMFHDFVFTTGDMTSSSVASYSLYSQPLDFFGGSIAYYETIGNNDAAQEGYGLRTTHRFFGKGFSLYYITANSTRITAEIITNEYRSDLIFKRDGQSFGDLSQGFAKYSRYTLVGKNTKLFIPLTVEYYFEQIKASSFGHFESWPFTSFVASIITNRLNYQVDGFIKHHSISVSSRFSFGKAQFNTEFGYHRIISDVFIDHWEPEILVFGTKNFTRDPFSIKDAHVGKLGVAIDYSWNSFGVNAFIEQYFPISITYRHHEPIVPSPTPPSPPPTEESRLSTDGGRRMGIQLHFSLL